MIDWFTFHRDFWKLTYVGTHYKRRFFLMSKYTCFYLYRLKYKKILTLDKKKCNKNIKRIQNVGMLGYIIYKVNIIINNKQT